MSETRKDLKTTDRQGRPYKWNGHYCEGSEVHRGIFLLWTRCGKHDVPGNAAHTGGDDLIDCEPCLAIAVNEKATE